MENYVLISDAAKEVEVESHVLRYWEEELNLPIHRNEQGHRFYTREDVDRFKQIKKLKEGGLQLKAIRMILKDGKLNLLTPMTEELEPGQEKISEKVQKGNIEEIEEERKEGGKEWREEDRKKGGKEWREEERKEGGKEWRKEDRKEGGKEWREEEKKEEKKEEMEELRTDRDIIEKEKYESRGIIKNKNTGADGSQEQLSTEEKVKRLKWLLQQLIGETLQENNRQLCEDIRESVIKELDYQFRTQEERLEENERKREQREEAYYQKLDELMRSKLKKGFTWKREEKEKRKLLRRQEKSEQKNI